MLDTNLYFSQLKQGKSKVKDSVFFKMVLLNYLFDNAFGAPLNLNIFSIDRQINLKTEGQFYILDFRSNFKPTNTTFSHSVIHSVELSRLKVSQKSYK